MASNWFHDLEDDFFSRPSRLRLLRTDPWGSLERLHEDLGGSDIFSDFAAKAASLRNRVTQGRLRRESPVKNPALRRASRSSEQSVDGIASPTPSSVNSAAFQYPEGGQGHVSFPASSCSNISECSDKSAESICTERSNTHSAVSEALPDGGEQRKVDSTESWVERNACGGVVGEGKASETIRSEVRPGCFQEYSKQQSSYTGASSGNSVASIQTCEERSSQTSSSKTVAIKSTKHSSASSKQVADSFGGGKPFRVPPNRSVFYDELDSSLGAGAGARRRARPLDHVASLVDEVVHHDRLFQTELDDFLRGRPKKVTSSRLFGMNDKQTDKRAGLSQCNATNENLQKENETLHEENVRLQQVLQEVTAVNKRWQHYNTDRRMYVQKLLATIQDLQEQMNQQGEAALQRAPPTSNGDSSAATDRDMDLLRQEHEEHTKLLRLQIKSYKEDWHVERREKEKAENEKEALLREVENLRGELMTVRTLLDEERNHSSTCTCRASQASHIASQDFEPRTTYQASFQVPYVPAEEVSAPYSVAEKMPPNIVEHENSAISSQIREDTERTTSSVWKTRTEAHPRSLFLGYPDPGLATVYAFSRAEGSYQSSPAHPSSSESNQPNQQQNASSTEGQGESIVCPNCSRVFPPSLRICFADHFEFCQGTDATRRGFPLS